MSAEIDETVHVVIQVRVGNAVALEARSIVAQGSIDLVEHEIAFDLRASPVPLGDRRWLTGATVKMFEQKLSPKEDKHVRQAIEISRGNLESGN